MKTNLLFIVIFITQFIYSQEPQLTEKVDVIERDAKNSKSFKFTIDNSGLVAAMRVTANDFVVTANTATSTMPASFYSISAVASDITANSGIYTFFVTVNASANFIPEQTLNLSYAIKLRSSGADIVKNTNFHSIKVLSQNDKINRYSYLAYVGTNFDLVDGIKAKNLFFATNILSEPRESKVGFYLSLYGNRTISRIDSIPNITRGKRVIDSIGNQYLINEKSDVVKKIQSDNIGALFSPLVKLCFLDLNKSNSPTKLYYSPSLEFILRRSTINITYTNLKELDPVLLTNLVPAQNYNLSYSQNNTYNIYDFNIGIVGFFLTHENDFISVRLNMNTGYATRYQPIGYASGVTRDYLFAAESTQYETTKDWFYTGKLWITDRTTGITLQAEINNNYKYPNPFYGVTLSKAFDFDKLGTIFKPLSTRTATP